MENHWNIIQQLKNGKEVRKRNKGNWVGGENEFSDNHKEVKI